MEVIQAVRKLGAALQQDERYIAYQIAQQNNDNDTELQNAIQEFNALRVSLNTELSKTEKDEDKIQQINEQIKTLYREIMSNENMQAYNRAKNELDNMVKQVNGIISLSLNGEDPETCVPSDCSGGCSSCAGCG